LACTQGSDTSLLDTLAHSYTPHSTPGPSPCIYKSEVQGLHARGSRGENELTNRLTLSLSLANDYNPYYEHTPLVRDNTSRVFPLVFHLAPTHLGRGTQRQTYSSVQGPPGSETSTFGAPPLPPCGKAMKGHIIKVETVLDRPIAPCRGSGAALATRLRPNR
jgi:hypothetical protein